MTQGSLEQVIAGLREGKLASFPTDTVPALAARPDRAEAIYTAKQRSLEKPLILMGATPDALWPFCQGTPAEREIWQDMAQQYWPGMLTLVLPASDRVPLAMHPKDPIAIGVRIPNSPIALEILAATGPLATTSANLSGRPTLSTLAEIETQFPQVLTLNANEVTTVRTGSGVPSTVARWMGNGWEILRQGAVTLES
ncbi:L-threonylcarbamoyladenylate synthase [Roseofilum casamattae]|uniref:L-threonylcarbamoyladenylate synthase n=1 Tax=Roseofilum casamattae BLCC-M143 TaxID=3022442 RepID=A0ABT7BX33_9CYAN|nr:L-threonylcarbamoyladenylate synthase [Roseofilum casamattae]MDJ1183079.1 L-threonylcarbamoyladenylate synthase [Roseofilum casamattae BLCC-M143]